MLSAAEAARPPPPLSSSAGSLSGSAVAAVHAADTAPDTFAVLEDSSQEIAQVVTVISGIAAQNRLLARNATVEAARAPARR